MTDGNADQARIATCAKVSTHPFYMFVNRRHRNSKILANVLDASTSSQRSEDLDPSIGQL